MKLILNVDNSNVPIVTHEQNEKISAEMENQLKKFAVKTNAPSSPEMVTSSLESGVCIKTNFP